MKTINITDIDNTSIIEQLNAHIKSDITNENGEEVLIFNNKIGSGTIRNRKFDWGISLLDYDVNFNDDVKIIFETVKKNAPIEFLFISEGNLTFNNTEDHNYVRLERFQNIIISNDTESKSIYVFPSNTDIKLNVIFVYSKKFLKKKNIQIDTLDDSLLSVFRGEQEHLPFKHLGSYNLTIADKIKALNKIEGSGIIKALSIEGQINSILALQILEHENFKSSTLVTDCLTVKDIRTIYRLVYYIVENISKPLSIKELSKESGLGSKKLQIGFKLLFSKSVNEYVRTLKLEIAKDLIKNTDKSISEIVYEIGYKSRSYFYKIFFEHFKVLPIDYKESLRDPKIKG